MEPEKVYFAIPVMLMRLNSFMEVYIIIIVTIFLKGLSFQMKK